MKVITLPFRKRCGLPHSRPNRPRPSRLRARPPLSRAAYTTGGAPGTSGSRARRGPEPRGSRVGRPGRPPALVCTPGGLAGPRAPAPPSCGSRLAARGKPSAPAYPHHRDKVASDPVDRPARLHDDGRNDANDQQYERHPGDRSDPLRHAVVARLLLQEFLAHVGRPQARLGRIWVLPMHLRLLVRLARPIA